MDFYTLQVFFLANVVKALVLFEQPPEECLMDIEEEEYAAITDKQLDNISTFFNKYNVQARQKAKEHNKSTADTMTDLTKGGGQDETQEQQQSEETPETQQRLSPQLVAALLDHIKMEMREFLRCSCLFFHFVTDVDFPDALATNDSDTFENMCNYLGLDTQLETYFASETPYSSILELFASHHDITNLEVVTSKIKKTGDPLVIMPCNRPVPTMVTLPEDYSDLINSVSDFSCPNNEHEEVKTPTMCLMCGEILCAQSYCCQPDLDGRNVGACTYHAYFCGAEIAPFLRIRDCQIVYLGKNKGCFVQPPYLDEYGETDQGLRRGNPLRLCPARYSKIHLTWLGHGLHEEIARLNDHSSAVTTQWHHM